MSYILESDFLKVTTSEVLDGLTAGDAEVWKTNERSAIEEAKSYLRHRYDADQEFRGIIEHAADNIYQTGERVFVSVQDERPEIYTALKTTVTGTPVTNSVFWKKGDDRNAKIVGVILIIILYETYARLNGHEIPQWIQLRYDGGDVRQTGGVIGYLKNIQKGTVQADIKLLPGTVDGSDHSGNRIAYGSASSIINDIKSI